MNEDGTWAGLFSLLLLSIWAWQDFGGEKIPVHYIKAAEVACATNGGLSYIRHEIMEREDYVCKNGAEGLITEHIKYTKEATGEHSKAE